MYSKRIIFFGFLQSQKDKLEKKEAAEMKAAAKHAKKKVRKGDERAGKRTQDRVRKIEAKQKKEKKKKKKVERQVLCLSVLRIEIQSFAFPANNQQSKSTHVLHLRRKIKAILGCNEASVSFGVVTKESASRKTRKAV